VVALVVPRFGALREWARDHGVAAATDEELVIHPRVVELYSAIAARVSERLARYETIKRVAVLPRDLEASRGELTPTLKAMRRVVERSFAEEIESLYR
jgi:long-chain acyl-CoA synthetase